MSTPVSILVGILVVAALIWVIWELIIKRIFTAGQHIAGAVQDHKSRQATELKSNSLLDEQMKRYGDH